MVQRTGVACLGVSLICWIFCTVSVEFVYGKINAAGINFTCHPAVKEFDITFGGADFSCQNDNIASSYCELKCNDSSFIPTLTIFQRITCQVSWDGKSKEMTPAHWIGKIPWCAPYLCRPPDVAGYGSGYTCDQLTFSNEAGTITGYKLGTRCTYPCPGFPGMSNVLECYDKGNYTTEVVPYILGENDVYPAAWRFIETGCEPAPCSSVWTLVEGSSPGLSCTNLNKLMSLCLFICHHLGLVPSHFDGTRCVMSENGISEWNRSPAICLDEPTCFLLNADENNEFTGWNCSNGNFVDSHCVILCGTYKTFKGSRSIRCTKLPDGSAVWRNLEEGYEDNVIATCVPLLCGDPLYDFPYGELITCTKNPRNALFSTCFMKCPEYTYDDYNTPIKISCIPDAASGLYDRGLFVIDSDPCLLIQCPEIPLAQYRDPHLDMNCTGVHYLDQCFFGCKTEGYQLNTNFRWMTCASHYSWYPPLFHRCIPEIPPPDPETGRIPIFRDNFLDKRYLIFDDLLGWEDSLKYCEARWGTLAMPKNLEIHEYLVDKIQTLNINKNSTGLFVNGVWMGMSDRENEGVWKFVDGDPVNLAPDLGDMTNGNTIPKFKRNATLGDYWWFIWAYNHFCTYEECKQQCANMGGTLANIISQEINDAVGKQIIDEFNFWKTLGDTLEPDQEPGNYFINIKGSETDRTVFIQGDGQRVYIFDQWYIDKWYDVPKNREDFAPYQNWQTWTDPEGFEKGQHCVSMIENANWIDQDCNMNLPLLCEKGPYPFERWLGRGTSSSEPNNNWSVEHCGGFMTELETPMWNDFDCLRELPFICEVDVECPWIDRNSLSPQTNFTCEWSSEGKPQCEFTCKKGYWLDTGRPMTTCVDSDGDRVGEWSPMIPNCVLNELFCSGTVFESLNDDTTVSCSIGNAYNSTCDFSCPQNMKLNNDVTSVTCEDKDDDDNGEWSDDIPECEDIFCSAVDTLVSGDTITSCTNGNFIQSSCTLSCLAGKRLSNGESTSTVTCVDADNDGIGEWDADPVPGCGDISCPTIDESSLVPVTTFSCTNAALFNSVCIFSCPSTMKVDGVDTTTCGDADNDGVGDWDNFFPACLNITCPLLDTIVSEKTSAVCSQSNIVESTCTLSCKEGEWLDNGDKTQIVTCEDSDSDGMGDWSANPSSCVGITCPKILPSELTSGTTYSCPEKLSYGAVCDFSCPATKRLESGICSISCDDSNDDGVGEWSEEIPYCVDILCPELANLVSNDTVRSCVDSNVVFSVCTLSCPAGKHLNNGEASSEVTCMDNDGDYVGEWNMEPPSCGDVTCPDIDSSTLDPNTEFLCTSSKTFGSVCTFSCPDTMKPDRGLDSIKCGDSDNNGIGEWDNAIPNCVNITCPQMASLVSSNVSFDCTNGNIKLSSCVLTCSEGQWLESGDKTQTVTCEDIDNDGVGDWSENPSDCAAITCPVVDLATLSSETSFNCSDESLFGSNCSFSCPDGMKLNNSNSVLTCEDSNGDGVGEWNAAVPECIDITCETINASAISPFSIVSCTDENIINSECTFSCSEGKKLTSDVDTVKCVDVDTDGFGEWNSTFTDCADITCPSTSKWSLSNGTSFTCTNGSSFDSVCTFTCSRKHKFENEDEGNIVSCRDSDEDGIGNWNATAPICTDVLCKMLDSVVSNETVVSCTDGSRIDSICSMSCGEGLTLADDGGSSIAVCEDINGVKVGEWNATASNCTEITCPAVDPATLSPETSFNCTHESIFGSNCSFSCPDGMKLNNSNSIISCEDSNGDGVGEWNATIPECIDITCEMINASAVSLFSIVNCTGGNVMNSECTFSCTEGKKIESDVDTVKCIDVDTDGFGEWNSTFPGCAEIVCPQLSARNFSSSTIFNCTNSFVDGEQSYGAMCTFRCSEGSILESKLVEETILCQDDNNDLQGEWNRTLPDCSAVYCEEVDSDSLGKTAVSCNHTNNLHSECMFECPDGMQVPNAISTINCKDPDYDGIGNWTDSIPVCYDVECDDITRSMVNNETFFTCSHWKCSFYCDDGTTLVGDSDILTCSDPYGNKTGRWSHDVPLCLPINCTVLNLTSLSPETAISCTNSHHVGSECTFICPKGMAYQTELNVMKCEDLDDNGVGGWDTDILPNCSQIFCSIVDWKVIPKKLNVNCSDTNYWGSECQFTCPEGEWMEGGITDMKCKDTDKDGNGEWSETMPNCERIQCFPEYSFLQDGTVNCTDLNFYNSMCNFTCDYSYRLIGFNPAMCTDLDNDGNGKWNESFPFCEEYEIIIPSDCPEYSDPANGYMSCTDNGYIGSVCTYYCDEGYVLFGPEDLECLEIDDDTAEWSDVYPVCSTYLGECSPPYGNPLHGSVSCTGKHYVTSVCTFTCKEEYHVVGNEVVTCDDNDYDKVGDWSEPEPICFPDVVKCKTTLESPEDGQLSCTNENIKDSVCTYDCDVGYYVAGSSKLTCTDDNNDGIGKWDNLTPTCETITCEEILPGSLTAETNYSCTNGNIGNSECSFSCPEKFRLSNGVSTIYCEDVNENSEGEWSDDIPECLPVTCEFDPDALDETMVYDCTKFNRLESVCDFHCPSGMKLTTSHNQTTCQDLDEDGLGDWDKELPDCTPILCSELDSETMSPQTSYSCSKLNHGNSECIFECPVGWKLDNGVEMIVCEDKDGNGDGEWSDDTPSCIPIICPEIDSDDLSPQTSFHCSDGNLGNSICQFSCPQDMRLDRDIDKVTCVDKNGDGEGEWSDKIPYCVFTCRPDLKAPDRGKYSCSDLNRAGSQCDFQCDSGFVLSHVNLVTCGVNDAGTDGTWKGDVPTCDPFEYLCPELGTFYLSPETEYTCTKLNKRASRCTFSCPAEMELDTGRTVIDCEDKNRDGIGEWNAKPPECIRTACSTASTKVKYGESICTKSHFIGSSCAFECKSGFHPQPPYNIICQENGLWNSSAPSCDATNCLPDLKEMFGPDANCLGGNEPGAECDVKCSHRSQKYGEKVTFVCANPDVNDGAGFWDRDLLSCAGCASGLLDIMFLLDASANWEMWYFSDMRDWLSEALNRIRRGINEGATWISVATFGSREKQCNLAYTVPKFKLEMKLDFRNMEDVKRRVRAIKHMGGCAHLGRGLNEALNHLESRHRPHVTPMIVLLLGGKSHDGVSNALTRVNNSDIPIFGVAYGKKAAKLLNDNWITHFNVTSAKDYKDITSPVLDALVKYDCKDHSLCSGPIENGTVTCILKQEGHASELCTIHCDDGFQLVGRETALCGDLNGDGRMEWISPHGVCKNISCPPLRPIENTQMQCSNGNLFSSTCRFWCNEGLSLIGLSQVICGDPDGNGIGEWHTRPPRCFRGLACQPELLAPRFGSVLCTRNNSFGSECRFSCEVGYTLHGSGLIVCRDAERNGHVMWDNPPPMCSEGCTSQFCGRDVIFLLDGSGSINQKDFIFAKNWVVEVFEEFQGEIDTGGTWVGVIQFSGESSFICASGALNPKYTVELELGRYPFRYVKETILEIPALRGCTATGDAIRQATKHFQALGREHIDKILILLTDGRSNDDVIEPAKEAELEGIKIIAVGIGSFNPDQLLAITGRFVSADNYGELANVLHEVQDEIMSDYIEGQYGGLGRGYETRPNLVMVCIYVALWSFWMHF